MSLLFKKTLSDIIDENEKEKSKFRIPNSTPVECAECGWNGIFKDCRMEKDSEGWEYPEYMVASCPKCGEYIDI